MKKQSDFNKIVKKYQKRYQPAMKKTGEQLAKAMKTAEKDIAKMYKVAQTHIELQLKHLQKEKLYHEIGKYVSQQLKNESSTAPGLEKFKKQLDKIDSDDARIKKKLSRMSKTRKKKK